MANRVVQGQNGTFETDITGWTAYASTIVRDTAVKNSGLASLKSTSTSTVNDGAYTIMSALTVGNTYRVSCWIRSSLATTVRVGFFTSAWLPGQYTDVVLVANTWTYVQFDCVASVASAYFWYGAITAHVVGNVINIDDVVVDDAPVTPPPAGGPTASKVKQAGAVVASTSKVRQAGAIVTATPKVRASGVLV